MHNKAPRSKIIRRPILAGASTALYNEITNACQPLTLYKITLEVSQRATFDTLQLDDTNSATELIMTVDRRKGGRPGRNAQVIVEIVNQLPHLQNATIEISNGAYDAGQTVGEVRLLLARILLLDTNAGALATCAVVCLPQIPSL